MLDFGIAHENDAPQKPPSTRRAKRNIGLRKSEAGKKRLQNCHFPETEKQKHTVLQQPFYCIAASVP
ncbi:hypothetical protein [Sphingobium sp.]|uniref:hypothetical protein n=1 Tax=Sphingobium sp. TaxID=1912891 RepID=UPI003B3B680E